MTLAITRLVLQLDLDDGPLPAGPSHLQRSKEPERVRSSLRSRLLKRNRLAMASNLACFGPLLASTCFDPKLHTAEAPKKLRMKTVGVVVKELGTAQQNCQVHCSIRRFHTS